MNLAVLSANKKQNRKNIDFLLQNIRAVIQKYFFS